MARPGSGKGVDWHHWLFLVSLMLAGESIYMLPFMRKTFQTTMESVFQVNSTEIGLLNSVYGVLEILCFLPGGWLADRFSARNLITISLVGTGAGGLYMATLPSYEGLLAVQAFWGITTILTFWAALIKATRLWAEADEQGLAFGALDGGRGFTGAVLASIAAAVFTLAATPRVGLVSVILVYSAANFVAAAAVWFLVSAKEARPEEPPPGRRAASFANVKETLAMPKVWFISVVILAAYLLFLGSYEFPAYAERGFDQTKEFGAWLGTFRDWLRPVAAVAAGLIADRIRATRAIAGAFAALIVTYGSLLFTPADSAWLPLLWGQVAVTALAVFALRGVYFALMEEARIPKYLTGTAVGAVSLVGFTPDVFGHLLAGWFVDSHPGVLGYQHYFGLLSLVALVGLVAVLMIRRRAMSPSRSPGNPPAT